MVRSHHPTHDVVIAGAGPVGLFLACELGLAGCSVLVLERASGPDSPLKTLPFGLRGLTLPTMDSLDRRDLLAPLTARVGATNTTSAAPWTSGPRQPGGHFAGLQFFRDRVDGAAWSSRRSAPREMMAVAMADLEAVLTARARELGVVIRHDRGVDSIEQVADGIVLHAGGERFQAGWLIGCDGGRSTVRKAAGIGLVGTAPEFTGYSMALRFAEPDPLRPGRQHTASGMYTYAPPGVVTAVDFDGGAHHRHEPLSRDHLEAVLRRVSGTDVKIASVELVTTWTDRASRATEYRKGRVLLAGDAAHVHAPLGGQGLNLGLGDAMNLGWKLAATIAGTASAALLDSYAVERCPMADRVLDWSRAQVALLRADPGTVALRSIVSALMDTRDGATYFAGRLWGADLSYGTDTTDHPLVGSSAPDIPLASGRRLNEALRDGRPLLLDFDPVEPLREIAARWAGQLGYDTGTPPAAMDCDAMLVRPDGVVAWVGTADTCTPMSLADHLGRYYARTDR